MTTKRLYAVVDSKFHGGGILFRTSSPREAFRWHRAHHDGCFNGRGCESLAYSDDGGETWYECEIDYDPDPWGGRWKDGNYSVHESCGWPLRPADETVGAGRPAL